MENYKQWVIKQGIEKAVKSLSKEAGGKEVVELVKDPTWQKLRESFVGTWKKTPDENVRRLKQFLGTNPSIDKLRIVLNYLTCSGFRTGNIKHAGADKLRDWVRNRLAEKREKLKQGS